MIRILLIIVVAIILVGGVFTYFYPNQANDLILSISRVSDEMFNLW